MFFPSFAAYLPVGGSFEPACSASRRESRDKMKNFYVYIFCNKRNGTLYTGVTSGIIKRTYEHKNKLVVGFTKKYNLHRLVWFEIHKTSESAITREERIKKWECKWNSNLLRKIIPGGMIYMIIFVRTLDSRSTDLGNDYAKPCGVC